MEKNITDRNSSFELLRVILMILIVYHHAITHGLGLDSFAPWSNNSLIIKDEEMNLYLLMNNLAVYAVNTFVIISGYFSIRSSWKKARNLLLMVLFYTLLFTTLPSILRQDYTNALFSLLIVSHTPYWFITDYLILMLFAPLLNKTYDEFDEKTMKCFTFVIIFIALYLGWLWGNNIDTSGYNFFHFIVLYGIGRAISKQWINISFRLALIVFCGSIALNTILGSYLYYTGYYDAIWRTFYYSNPLIVLSATMLIMIVKEARFYSRTVNYLAASSLGIYLFQNTDYISHEFYNGVARLYRLGGGKSLTFILLCSFGVCMLSILIDKIRILIFKIIKL